MITILGISGSLRHPSYTHTMIDVALTSSRESGARVELLDLRVLDLPLYDPRGSEALPIVHEIRDRMEGAHGYIIGTPEYHWSFSGAVKNFFDYLYPEVNGKLCGCLVASRSDTGNTVVGQLHEVITAMHGWVLPYGAIGVAEDFDESGHLINPRLRDRLVRLGRDMTVYGELLYDRFQRDSILSGGPQLGFAPWHARE